jgi:hypothetical protein
MTGDYNMNSLLKKTRSLNWWMALGQIALIFIGVSVAIWFENWNTHLKDQQREREFLNEILNGLVNDSLDINSNLFVCKTQRNACRYLIDSFKNGKEFEDSTSFYFSALPAYAVLIANTGGYETLKSTGLDQIENDSLRREIVNMYEVIYKYQKEIEKLTYDYSSNFVMPACIKNFKKIRLFGLGKKASATPVDFKALQKNDNFAAMLQILSDYKYLEERITKRTQKFIGKTTQRIRRELNRIQ